MVEGARLESVYAGNRIEGSNPSLSAKLKPQAETLGVLVWRLCQVAHVSSFWTRQHEYAFMDVQEVC